MALGGARRSPQVHIILNVDNSVDVLTSHMWTAIASKLFSPLSWFYLPEVLPTFLKDGGHFQGVGIKSIHFPF